MSNFSQKIIVTLVAVVVVWGSLWYLQREWISADPAKIKVDPQVEQEIWTLLEKSKTARHFEKTLIVQQILDIGRKGVPVLAQALWDEDPRVRVFATNTLQYSNNASVIPHLNARLADENPVVRRAALMALAHLGAVETLPAIVVVLNDEDKATRCYAALALGNMGHDDAVVPLTQTLQNDPYPVARQAAANSLGEIGNEKAVESLIESLENENSLVRSAALVALNRITGEGLGAEKELWTDWWNEKRHPTISE